MMTIQRSVDGPATTILTVAGKIDAAAAAQLQTEILGVLQRSRRLILDLEGVSYVSSAGLRALIIGQKTAQSKKAVFELRGAAPAVAGLLKSAGFSAFERK